VTPQGKMGRNNCYYIEEHNIYTRLVAWTVLLVSWSPENLPLGRDLLSGICEGDDGESYWESSCFACI